MELNAINMKEKKRENEVLALNNWKNLRKVGFNSLER